MHKLYARKNAGSAAVEALLMLAEMPCEIIDVPRQADRSIPPWYCAINARGEVPALVLPDGSLMTESAAIMIYLADLPECMADDGSRLAPAPADGVRPSYLRWMIYLATAPYMSDLRLYYPERYSTDPSHAAAVKARAIADYERDMAYLASGISGHGSGPFICGNQLTAVDIYAAMLISWAPDMEKLTKSQSRLLELYRAVAAVPAIRKVFDRNDMP
jgi:glutathione S-transferase